MADDFRYDPAKYHARVSKIAQHVVASGGSMPTMVPHGDVDGSVRHDAAITTLNEAGRRVSVVARGPASDDFGFAMIGESLFTVLARLDPVD